MTFPRHIFKSQQFGREELEYLFGETEIMRSTPRDEVRQMFPGYILASLFYEESTRTRFSFEAAMIRLGGQQIATENAKKFSSSLKGEGLLNTTRVVSGYADIIVLRHDTDGAAEKASSVSLVPVINGGDGPGQHPTQALIDIYTIRRELGQVDGISIALVGDLANGRAVRSLAYLLAKYKIRMVYLVAAPLVRMDDDIKEYFARHDIPYCEASDLRSVAKTIDVLYQTRIQKERFGKRIKDYLECCGQYIVDKSILEAMPSHAIVMHPLPINENGEYGEPPEIASEIADNVEQYPRVAYIRQAHNGLYVRIALLKILLTASQS